MKSADCNADIIWPQVGLPEHRCSTRRAKVHSEPSSLLPIADIDFGRSFGANFFLFEVGTNAEHRTGSALTLSTMAGDDSLRIGGYYDTQSTAGTMCSSRHGTPPSSGEARVQEGGRQSDPFTADRAQFMRRDTTLGRVQVITGERRRLGPLA
jgi:hypothetical protein